jgi:O-methyltransferase
MSLLGTLKNLMGGSITRRAQPSAVPLAAHDHLPREDTDFLPIWLRCQPYTMTSFARGLALFRSVRYLVENCLDGDIVECGVWRGGSSMVAMETLVHLCATNRRIVMLDTFEGMTEPAARDVDLDGNSAAELLEAEQGKVDGVLCYASLEEVKRNVASTGYPLELVEFVKGDIRHTASAVAPREIALLRLDTDFYDSTKVELQTFYPRLRDKGVLIIDDYGHWAGAREAVDEFFVLARQAGSTSPLLSVIDYTGRLAVK